ncbi:hypothetical protein FNF29_01032 [Cafeteria roenbergensis]|uniref:thiamine phosphate synthase n=1 Tax=Cafeteria roenbergensis TaxID=33653 RepID=A0A5A8CSW2_CAFRO|nr:hypothetical protein FNF29_01032 [Cafeteria roenbergensis]|eukprot:KAA0156242.1 hypothetical protein FNF29_01032 [Cafeteria roenbergensis]
MDPAVRTCSLAFAYRPPVLRAALGRLQASALAALCSQDAQVLELAPESNKPARRILAELQALASPTGAAGPGPRSPPPSEGRMPKPPQPWRVAVWARVRHQAIKAIVAAASERATSPAGGISPWARLWMSKDAEAVADGCTMGADVADAVAAAHLPPGVPRGASLLLAIAGGHEADAGKPVPTFLDFDGTLTTADTTAHVLEAAARAALASGGESAQDEARSSARAVSEQFAEGYAKHAESMRGQLREQTRRCLAAALSEADAFDSGAAAKVEAAMVLQGTRPCDLRVLGEERTSLAPAALQCVASLRGCRGLDTRVLTASLGGAAFVRGALRADAALAVHAPELAASADCTHDECSEPGSTGRFVCDPPPVHSASDKLRTLLDAVGMQERLASTIADPAADGNRAVARAVVVGDSMGDLRALLGARVGVLAVPPAETSVLQAAISAARAPLRPLLALAVAAAASDVESMGPAGEAPSAASTASSASWPLFVRSNFGTSTHPCARSAALLELVAMVCGADEVLCSQGLSASRAPRHGAAVPPRVLAVAGSDSGGGAGIQADIKAVTALGAFVATALTSVTAQNTKGVQSVHVVPARELQLQLASVIGDVGADTIKTGLLPNAAAVEATVAAVESARRDGSPGATTGKAASHFDAGVRGEGADAVWMRELALPPPGHLEASAPAGSSPPCADAGDAACAPWLVVDPVMVAASGHRFVDDETVEAIRARLLPLATVCTPNIPEAQALLGRALDTSPSASLLEAMAAAARELAALGSAWVLLKGGHAPGVLATPPPPGLESVDVLVHGASGKAWAIGGPAVSTRNTHGTGCTLASAIAAGLAKGRTVPGAVLSARRYLAEALFRSRSLAVGNGGHGPVNHAFQLARWTTGGEEALGAPSVRDALRVYAVTDSSLLGTRGLSVEEAVAEAVRGGVSMVQVRDKEAPTGELIAMVRRAIRASRASAEGRRIPVIVNDRADVALVAGADGLHVGQSDMSILDARQILGPQSIIGVTVSNAEQARLAVSQGADYLGTDPVFETPTKTDSAAIGVGGLRAIVEAAGSVPVVAIGGLNASNAASVLASSGAAGVAVVSAVFGQDDICGAATVLRTAVDGSSGAGGAGEASAASAASSPCSAEGPAAKAALAEPFPIPPFAKSCLEAAGKSWSASFTHPFVLGLADGTLDADRFKFYQMQDARYLESFADACAYVAARCPDPDDKGWFLRAATLALEVERSLHLDFGTKLGYTPADIAALQLTPNAKAYGDHMVQSAMRAPLVEAVAALAPCPWLYTDLGAHLASTYGPPADDHPYAAWLRTYADDSFSEYMGNLLSRMEKFADEASESVRARARAAFATSSRYEYMFWDQAWEKQSWPV